MTVVSQFASELLDAFEQKIQTETLPKLVKGGRNTYDPEHGGNSPQPRVNGRYIHSLAVS